MHTDEESKLENMPEGMQQGEKGDKMQEGIDALGETFDLLETIDTDMQEAIDKIEEATNA